MKSYLNSMAEIVITGHADSDGSHDYKRKLSKECVEGVKQFLLSEGIPKQRIGDLNVGESDPKTDNNTLEPEQQNRRIHIQILPKEKIKK